MLGTAYVRNSANDSAWFMSQGNSNVVIRRQISRKSAAGSRSRIRLRTGERPMSSSTSVGEVADHRVGQEPAAVGEDGAARRVLLRLEQPLTDGVRGPRAADVGPRGGGQGGAAPP